jgi:hypothetical protein
MDTLGVGGRLVAASQIRLGVRLIGPLTRERTSAKLFGKEHHGMVMEGGITDGDGGGHHEMVMEGSITGW